VLRGLNHDLTSSLSRSHDVSRDGSDAGEKNDGGRTLVAEHSESGCLNTLANVSKSDRAVHVTVADYMVTNTRCAQRAQKTSLWS
jgi:hypothetical protein